MKQACLLQTHVVWPDTAAANWCFLPAAPSAGVAAECCNDAKKKLKAMLYLGTQPFASDVAAPQMD